MNVNKVGNQMYNVNSKANMSLKLITMKTLGIF